MMRKEVVERAETALRELGMNVSTQADQRRINWVRRGMRVLDDEQADARTALDKLNGEMVAVLEATPGAIRVMEGGGPENPIASIAVTMSKLRSEIDRLQGERVSHITRVPISPPPGWTR